MKTMFKNLFLLLLTLALTSSFVSGPVTNEVIYFDEGFSAETTYGGAFLVFAGKNGGNIKMTELRGQTELKVEGCAKGSRIYTFALDVNRNGKVNTYQSKSNTLTKEMVLALEGLKSGDTFEFKSMKAYLPNGKDVVEVHGQKFVVV